MTAAALALAALLAVLFIPRSGEHGQSPPEQIRIAASTDPSSALIFVAQEKGLFRSEGVEAKILMHTTGKDALASVEQGGADLATVADTAFMFAVMDNEPVTAIASLAESSRHHRIIGLRSHGISKPSDLRGKRIGVPLRTTGEFFLYTFLLFRDISLDDVTLVNVPPERMASALEQGTVDAVSTWFPTVTSLEARLRGRIIEFEDDNYLMAWNLVGAQDFVRKNPKAVVRVLRALVKARDFSVEHPDEAIAITSRMSSSDPAVLRRDWTNYRLGLRLSEALIIDLEDQARWALKLYYPHRGSIPDFTDHIYAAGLDRVDPAAVGILSRRGP